MGRHVAEELRERVEKLANKRELQVVPGHEIRSKLEYAGFHSDSSLGAGDLKVLTRVLRADELVLGEVERLGAERIRVSAVLRLARDERLIQPLPSVEGPTLQRVADELARHAVAARRQLAPQRRCENALRAGRPDAAVQFAREGVELYPRAVLARTCLIYALGAARRGAHEVLGEARQILAVDSMSFHALLAAAIALDSLRMRDEAATMYLRLAATAPDSLELTERVIWALLDGGSASRAEGLVVRVSDAHPEYVPLLRQKWRVLVELRKWKEAIRTGEALLARDGEAEGDSTFHLRLAGAYRADGQVLKAVQAAARGVAAFPGDVRLYALYTQLIRGESEVVIARGLERFPRSAELHALNARALRERGKLEESLAASHTAVAFDSSLAQGQLMIAQTELELGRPDSALVAIRRGLQAGDDSALVAQFALSKGNQFFRAASGSKRRDDFQVAMRFLALADSVRPSVQSKFLLGASAFSVTTMALTEAPTIGEHDKARACQLSRLGGELLPLARSNLEAGAEIQPDAVKQYLEYLGSLQPFVDRQMSAFCPATAAPAIPGTHPARRN